MSFPFRRSLCRVVLACALASLTLGGLAQSGRAQEASSSNATQKQDTGAWRKAWKAQWLKEHSSKKSAEPATQAKKTASKSADSASKKTEVSSKKAEASSKKAEKSPVKTVIAAKSTQAKSTPAPEAKSKPVSTKPVPVQPKATKPAPAVPAASLSVKTPKADALYSQTKPDGLAPTTPTARPQESPLSAIGDSGRLIFYLVPTLLVIVLCLRLLKNYQERTGRLPAAVQRFARASEATERTRRPSVQKTNVLTALLGGFHLNNARSRAGSNIHLVESLPIGGANLHLVEVRGRLLLLGATGMNLSLLSEFAAESETDAFQDQLRAAAADLDTLGLEGSELPMGIVVGTLDDEMQDTRGALERRLNRLRALQEDEDTYA